MKKILGMSIVALVVLVLTGCTVFPFNQKVVPLPTQEGPTFDRATVKVGDVMGDMWVAEIKDAQILFNGSAVLSGEIFMTTHDNPLGGKVCVRNLSQDSLVKLPREKNDTRTPFFCFRNTKDAQRAFDVTPGGAPKDERMNIPIAYYAIDLREGEVVNTAVLGTDFKSSGEDPFPAQLYKNQEYGFAFGAPLAQWGKITEMQSSSLGARLASVAIFPTSARQDYSARVDVYSGSVNLPTIYKDSFFLVRKDVRLDQVAVDGDVPFPFVWKRAARTDSESTDYIVEHNGVTYHIGGLSSLVDEIAGTFYFIQNTSIKSIDPASIADAAWGIPALPSGFTWKVSSKGPSNKSDKVMGPQGKALDLPGKTYIHEYTDASAPKWDSGVFAYYAKALARDLWQHSVIDAKGREFTAPAADGMLSGSVVGELQIQNNTLRAIIYWNKNTSSKKCMEVPGEPSCPAQNYEQGVFISDPVPLNSIPGEADKG